ncbi:MAG: aldehyde dehydrogenase family protein [Paracoccaceae bacterium]|nr:aldehyde dehydrogenase family protein [Paracoccaceae bacterium]
MNIQNKLFINGEFVESQSGKTFEVLNPFDNSVITNVSEAQEEDIDKAVIAARAAFPAWRDMSAMDRGHLLLKLADAIEKDSSYLSKLESMDTGHPVNDCLGLDIPRTVVTYRYFGGMADKFQGSVPPVEQGFLNYVTREPIGVVGQIVPWNFPLMFTGWKLGPALAAGNTVVMKPAEITPLSTLRIAQLSVDVGFPPGVINILPGKGSIAGEHLSKHQDVDKISFTGSTEIGKRIVENSAGNLKRVQLELGGKGANIVFEDANIPAAVGGSAFAIFHNQGQACIAGSRLILHESIADEFTERFIALAKSIKLGDPLDSSSEMGPLTSRLHQERVLNYVKIALEEGGELLTGGKIPEGFEAGNFIEPTVMRVEPNSRVCQEEVFGPFVTISTFSDDDEAIEIANNSEYGLGSGLWTNNLQRAHLVAKNIQAGMCWINCYKRVNPGSPFGGIGKSGYGREMGFEAMHDYTEAKSVWVNVDAKIPPFYKR